MSIKTWREEFLPPFNAEHMTEVEAIQHSLNKWKGLRKENLKKHGLLVNAETLTNSSNCSLCQKHDDCNNCPINTYTLNCSRYGNEPWGIWIYEQNPEPMIEALEKALHDYTGMPA